MKTEQTAEQSRAAVQRLPVEPTSISDEEHGALVSYFEHAAVPVTAERDEHGNVWYHWKTRRGSSMRVWFQDVGCEYEMHVEQNGRAVHWYEPLLLTLQSIPFDVL
jgi:hypothetical protein